MYYEITLDMDKLNPYQQGFINGMIHILIGQPEQGVAMKRIEPNLCIITVDTDTKGIHEIYQAIEKAYPGVIVTKDD